MKNAIIHAKNAMEPLKANAPNAIHLYMKIFYKKMTFLSNVFPTNNFAQTNNLFMSEKLITKIIKVNV